MNIKRFLFRDKQEIAVDIVEVWEVRWCGVVERYKHSDGLYNEVPQVKVFTSLNDAEEFKSALNDAFRITKNELNLPEITIKKQEV